MFVLSPAVETTAASASARPASSSTVTSIPCPTTKPPRQVGPRRPSASSSSSTTVTSQPSAARPLATAEPTRPHPMTTPLTAAQPTPPTPPAAGHFRPANSASVTADGGPATSVFEHSVGERDDEHLARRAAKDEVDGRREEAGLAPPARRRAEDYEVGVPPARLVDDGVTDRPRAHDVA